MICKSRIAATAIEPYTIVKPSAESNNVTTATAATDNITGVACSINVNKGDVVDIVQGGYAEVRFGGTVAAGDKITSDTQGRAVKATAGNRILGISSFAAVENDINEIVVSLS